MENKDLRRQRLLELIRQFGSIRKLGEAVAVEPSQLSQIKTGFRNMGSVIARRIERRLSKPVGWMDTPEKQTNTLAAMGMSPELLQLIDIYYSLDPNRQHELVAHANSLLARTITKPTTAAPFAGVSRQKVA